MRQSKAIRKAAEALADVTIIGGGPVGSSIALHLALANGKTPSKKIVVVERDNSYKSCSAMLSAGGIRQQFSVKENILMSMYGVQFLKNIGKICKVDHCDEVPDVQFHEHGYLYLGHDEKSRKILEANHAMQKECGADWMALLNAQELEKKFPWLNCDGISVGSYGTKNEGYFDPWSLVSAMKAKAISLGVEYIEGDVTGATVVNASSSSSSSPSNSDSALISSIDVKQKNAGTKKIKSGTFVNATGAWAGQLVDKFASQYSNPSKIHPLPVKPRKRCIFTVHCSVPCSFPPSSTSSSSSSGSSSPSHTKPAPSPQTPLVIDPSGCYFRPEGGGGRFIVGVSPPEDNDPDCNDNDLQHIDYSLFTDVIWPHLGVRVPAFEAIKQTGAWAGFYEYNTVDQNAIIGYHCDIKNLILCNGFSGHGLQQSPAAGRAVAELIMHNAFQTIDLRRFNFERIVEKKPILETGIV